MNSCSCCSKSVMRVCMMQIRQDNSGQFFALCLMACWYKCRSRYSSVQTPPRPLKPLRLTFLSDRQLWLLVAGFNVGMADSVLQYNIRTSPPISFRSESKAHTLEYFNRALKPTDLFMSWLSWRNFY